jgi:signal transduction histidine kinase
VLGLRGRLLAVVLIGALLTVTLLTVGFNVALRARLDADATALARARAGTALGLVSTDSPRLRIGEAEDRSPTETQTWLFAGRALVERPRAVLALNIAAASLAGGPERVVDVPGTRTRLYAKPISRDHVRLGTLVAGVSLAPYQRSEETALIGSVVFAAVILIVVGLAAFWLIGRALRPVAQMTADASNWSEHDLSHRFSVGEAHDELTRLAATFDRLLDRLAASLRREQRFSAELSHELRTPLSRIVAEVDLALRRDRGEEEYRDALAAIRMSAARMGRTLDALLTAARAESRPSAQESALAPAVREAVYDATPLADQRDVRFEVEAIDTGLRAGTDAELIERVLSPVLDNASRFACSEVRVRARRGDEGLVVEVTDDGPGVSEDERERVFEPGVTMDGNGHRGAGLGLALARRLAHSAGGDVQCQPRHGAGARFDVILPEA